MRARRIDRGLRSADSAAVLAVVLASVLAAVLAAGMLTAIGCTPAPPDASETLPAPGETGGTTEATGATTPGGGSNAQAPGPQDEAAIKAAVQTYVLGQSEIEAKDYTIENVQMMNDNSGVAWAAASIMPKAKNLDPAAVVLKRGADGKWVGVEIGTSLEGSPALPPEVRQQFFGAGE